MKRRDVLKTALAGATALAAPRVVQADAAKTIPGRGGMKTGKAAQPQEEPALTLAD